MPKFDDPERQRIDDPEPELVTQGKCGRWRNGEKTEALKRYEAGDPYDGSMRCKKPSEDRSQQAPCKFHGGKSLEGAAHPNFTTGRYMKYKIPEHIRETMERALDNPRMLEMSDEIALIDSRIQELLTQMETGESRDAWHRARTALNQLRAAFGSGDQQAIRVAVGQLYQVIEQGQKNQAVWDEVLDTIDHRRQVVETERRRIEAEASYLTADAALTLIMRTSAIVRQYLPAQHYMEFQKEMQQLTGVRDITPMQN